MRACGGWVTMATTTRVVVRTNTVPRRLTIDAPPYDALRAAVDGRRLVTFGLPGAVGRAGPMSAALAVPVMQAAPVEAAVAPRPPSTPAAPAAEADVPCTGLGAGHGVTSSVAHSPTSFDPADGDSPTSDLTSGFDPSEVG